MARPRSIPEEEALERALMLFWQKGYDRTSIADLSAAIGVGPSSIYNAFGSKADLFRRALDRYMETYARTILESLEGGVGGGVVPRLRDTLGEAVRLYQSGRFPSGCALLQGGGAGTPEDSEACSITLDLKHDLESRLEALFEAAAAAGEPLRATPGILAKYVLGTMRGLAQLACDGVGQEELLEIAKLAAGSCVE